VTKLANREFSEDLFSFSMNNFVISHHCFNALYLIANKRFDFRNIGFFASLPLNVFKILDFFCHFRWLRIRLPTFKHENSILSMKPPSMINMPYISFDKFSAACVTEGINSGFFSSDKETHFPFSGKWISDRSLVYFWTINLNFRIQKLFR